MLRLSFFSSRLIQSLVKKIQMVQVVHAYNKTYPFGLKKESQNTYVQQSKLNLKQLDIAVLRQKAKIYQSMNSLYFIKLNKVLKEENNLHFIYEYYETSIEKYLGLLKKSVGFSMNREIYKCFQADFIANMNEIIDCLIQSEIKAVLLLQNIACNPKSQKDYSFALKTFIDTDAQYLSIIKHNYQPKDTKQKEPKVKNHQYLVQYYDAERKRLAIEFQQLAQRIFGKINESVEKKQSPNFIINGTKLIFLNKDEKQKESHQQEEKIKQKVKITHQVKQLQPQVKEKSQKKIEKVGSADQKKQDKAKAKEEKDVNFVKSQKKKVDGPIIDFDQSFQPEFKPQEFTKQKTFIYEETDYLDSLEQQLKKIAAEKKQQQVKKVQSSKQQKMMKSHERKRQSVEQSLQTKIKKYKTQLQQNQTQTKSEEKNTNNDSINETNMIASTKSNTSNCNNSNESTDKKPEKVNKYKMKIITSHQIEIEGGGQGENAQEIEKQIINGLKNGKISINDLTNSNQKTNLTHKNEAQEVSNKDKLTSNSLANNRIKNKEEELSKVKPIHEVTKISTEQKEKKLSNQTENTQILKLKEPPPNKIKTINEIIQKITNNHQNQQGATLAKHEDKKDTRTESKANVQDPIRKNNQNQTNALLKKQSSQSNQKALQTQKNELAQQPELKAEKNQNYINKIKQAKIKAQQLLREYTKKKQ